MKKQIQIFMVEADEWRLSLALRDAFPGVRFVDDNIWKAPRPKERTVINECATPYAFLWNQAIYEHLPMAERREGEYEGPTSGVVIQFLRSRLHETALLSGRVAAGVTLKDERSKLMVRFVGEVWKLLREHGTTDLVAVDPVGHAVLRDKVTGYIAGNETVRWLQEDPRRVLKDRSTQNYFLPRLCVALE